MSRMPTRFHRRSRRGANALEFALTLPFFLFITFGMMEYGWYFSRTALVNGALAEACREGSLIDPVNPPAALGACVGDQCIVDRVEEVLLARINGSNMACTDCSAVVSGVVPNRVVECTAEVDYTAMTSYLPANTNVPSRIDGQLRFRLEWQRVNFP